MNFAIELSVILAFHLNFIRKNSNYQRCKVSSSTDNLLNFEKFTGIVLSPQIRILNTEASEVNKIGSLGKQDRPFS